MSSDYEAEIVLRVRSSRPNEEIREQLQSLIDFDQGREIEVEHFNTPEVRGVAFVCTWLGVLSLGRSTARQLRHVINEATVAFGDSPTDEAFIEIDGEEIPIGDVTADLLESLLPVG